ncbi:hypothetical protein ABG768_025714, partial [Culter alburnus]
INSSPAYGADVQVEAAGLLRAMSEPSFKFIAEMVHKILSYLDPPNLMLQAENMDLLTIEERIIYEDLSDDTELRRMYFSCIDAVCGKIKEHFGERNFYFLVSKVKPLLDLTNTPIVESEYTVAHQFLSHRLSMLLRHKANLIKLAFEKELTKKFREE